MTLTEMLAAVRRDLKDEVSATYRWSDNELNRAIARAVAEISKYSPYLNKSTLATTNGSAEITITTLTNLMSVERVEFPVDQVPRTFVRFNLFAGILSMRDTLGTGANCYVYWFSPHSMGATSTLPVHLDTLVALGATAYAALSQSQYSTDKANYGGENVDRDFLYWAKGRLMDFEAGLKKLNRDVKQKVLYLDE